MERELRRLMLLQQTKPQSQLETTEDPSGRPGRLTTNTPQQIHLYRSRINSLRFCCVTMVTMVCFGQVKMCIN